MKRTKKALAVVLSLSMLASITPQIVLANSNVPDRYEEVGGMQSIVDDAELHVYSTKKGGTIELTDCNGVETTFTQGIGYREYTATPADGWIWKGWTYEQLYQGKDLGNRTDLGWGKRYSFSNDGSDWNSAYNGTGQTISVNRLLTTGETVGNKITYNIYANFNPTIYASASEGGTITNSSTTEVEYGTNKQYSITADEGKGIASVTVDGQAVSEAVGKDNFIYDFTNVREPHTINVTFTNELYTVTYTDGVEGQEIFKDEVYSNLKIGDATPAFKGSLERKDYVFTGWNPEVTDTVEGTAVYIATWADDKNNNGTPDDKEEKFTVTYTDGVENEEIFKDQSYADLLSGTKTPKFQGEPKRNGYVFTGWTPEVTETVKQTVTYSAQWAVDENGNGKPDNDEKYIVSYRFINEASDKELPEKVNALLPKAQEYVYGVKVVPAILKTDRVETTDGVWLFEGWNKKQIDKLTKNTEFIGIWTFEKNAGIINHIPVISADDKAFKVGDTFSDEIALKGVTAYDDEDKDITSSVTVHEHDVNTSVAGDYTVTYKVTDSQGATAYKTVNVYVYPKTEAINHIPAIHAVDKTFTVGDTFDPKKDVTASDQEDGDITSSIEVVENTVDTAKAGTYTITYKVTDSKGASCTKTIYVTVNPKMESLNEIPVINAEDKTLAVGDSFDPMKDVTASDKENGDLTAKIEVINNTVDTTKAGTYTVTYKVTDKDGASVTKTIAVTVKDKEQEEQPTTPTKPDKGDNGSKGDKGNNSSTDTKKDTSKTGQSVKTGDTSNVLLWSVIAMISLAGVVTISLIKRRKSHSK